MARSGARAQPAAQGRERPHPSHVADGVRLQKALATAGVGSRRTCETMIAAGRVRVDGTVVRGQGLRIDPEVALVEVDGMRVSVSSRRVYLALHKPKGVLSAMSDERGRPSLGDYVRESDGRVFHVGRLDSDSEGLILLTNDGDLANRLSHPSFGVPKVYLADVPGPVPRDLGKRLKAGIDLEDGPVTVDRFRVVDAIPGHAVVEVTLHEGRKHVVRRLLAEVGHPVTRLVRVAVGPVLLGDMRPGSVRPLTQQEIGALYADVGLGEGGQAAE